MTRKNVILFQGHFVAPRSFRGLLQHLTLLGASCSPSLFQGHSPHSSRCLQRKVRPSTTQINTHTHLHTNTHTHITQTGLGRPPSIQHPSPPSSPSLPPLRLPPPPSLPPYLRPIPLFLFSSPHSFPHLIPHYLSIPPFLPPLLATPERNI